MQKTLLYKILAILALTLVICLLLAMIQGTIHDRSEFRAEAVASIAADSVREQSIIGPVMVIPYTDEFDVTVPATTDAASKTETVRRSVSRVHLVFPNQLTVDGRFDTDYRYRGIHRVLYYSGQHALSGDFDLPLKSSLPRTNSLSRITVGQASIAVGIEDVRGIRNIPTITWGKQPIEFQQGTGSIALGSGLHADLPPMDMEQSGRVNFAFNLGLDGIERQHFSPVARNNQITLASKWPHPQFGGRFLPSTKDRSISDDGFKANWSISSLSTATQQQLRALQEGSAPAANATPAERIAAAVAVGGGTDPRADRFSVAFIEPVNVYSLAGRATKYGLLFVALTFAAFFIFEILKRLPIHPVQYLLVGLALVLFFLLLVGLSEHIPFVTAYLIASTACILLLGFYLSFVLRNRLRGLGFGVALTVLYGALYGLLSSENNALVLGSILLFAVLGAIMVATRKVDWYQVGKTEPVAAGEVN
ncbi:cell envelope integrity protein CreD [Massilia sp. CCM 9210]|uniref:cell envelope integrity protein CreD n=1 Tax=Massilia scottii TaxID=3057166 RepID=UPI0027969CAE|nr:cell envelope integrity protein CreD [Massilia sp. CCM 9210]MDQ1814719.1 cell envelope integrity protein CreD [Massilia sp. CCM 9210]